MYSNAAYLYLRDVEVIDNDKPLLISSCGMTQLNDSPIVKTERPNGRADYQLLFITEGRGHFYFNGSDTVVEKGNIILYRPHEPQFYFYYKKEKISVFWIHFTGKDVERILAESLIPSKGNIFRVGNPPDAEWILRKMILELQLFRSNFSNLLNSLFQHLLVLFGRNIVDDTAVDNNILTEIENAMRYFFDNYNQQISIEDYAREHNMSACWFIRSFRKIVKMTPMQYVLKLRINNAKRYLETQYNVNETAKLVGYDDPYYFSRVFHKYVGCSPQEYKARLK